MFRYHVTITDSGVLVENLDGSVIGKSSKYKTISDLPDDIQTPLKQMLWVDPSDQTLTDTLGIRIGENIFWIL